MKKHSLLMLLPFSLIITGCSGNLKKGSIFNEKFMKVNFGEKYEKTYEFIAPKKVEHEIGTTTYQNVSPSRGDLVFVRNGSNSGFYNIRENKYALPMFDYSESGSNIKTITGFNVGFPFNYKMIDGVRNEYLYDEYGNKIFEGPSQSLKLEKQNLEVTADNKVATLVKVNDMNNYPLAYAYYDIDDKFVKVLTPEEYIKEHEYSADFGESLFEYGHSELTRFTLSGGGSYNYKFYNLKKHKYISSFSVPVTSSLIMVGNYIYYQIEKDVHERENKYDYFDGTGKKNVETYRVNYLNGKEQRVKTNIVFSQIDIANKVKFLKDSKGKISYLYLEEAKEIGKDKSLSSIKRSIVLNNKFKEIADVSGMNLMSAKPFGEKYWSIGKTVYNSKMKEVGYLDNSTNIDARRIAKSGDAYGLVDYTGKYILDPVWSSLSLIKHDKEGEFYIARNEKGTKSFKVQGEKLSEIHSLSDAYEFVEETGSKAHLIFQEKESSKKVVWDALGGSISDVIDPGTVDNTFLISNSDIHEGRFGGALYKVGTNFFSITAETRVTKSYIGKK